MPSIRSLTSFAATFFSQASILSQSPLSLTLGDAGSCPTDSPLSCHNSTAEPSCCFVTPGGQLLLTQFWDTNPTVGPVDSWTLHGLWPDNCDGSYPQYCHFTPQYHNITSILSSHSASSQETLSFMETYWLPYAGTLEHFWQHEFNKHATCINTLSSTCYSSSSTSTSSLDSDYTPGDEVVDFFFTAVTLFKTLDTYSVLKEAGITPSRSKVYSRKEIKEALEQGENGERKEVRIGCRGGRLDEVWYSFNVRGSLQGGEFERTGIVGKMGRETCPAEGIKYIPKD